MFKIHLNIGSNQGCRRYNIERAATLIEHIDGVAAAMRSEIVESEPWGFNSTNKFLNMGMLLTSRIPPLTLFARLKQIQDSIGGGECHRRTDGSYADRIIDIDMIAACDTETGKAVVIDNHQLTLPHPRMQQRDFVLLPMAQLDPMWQHPVSGLTPMQLLQDTILSSNK
ncbi:MAG: 2-amino-4-hydroxy-6-hydroxymethyldihydropteridine diphosphokinase [Muribaculum sp.]|nr:2-amino-4-hydroxy-6-hydroxymethyldihydropteridine diphosphokinase [Muribaculaceae bacterium]MCM1081528.1 2-amino-4-hydroxy-6-hydroxymethyldihydropteridine diphosphokinase [Muribaculum sp.]